MGGIGLWALREKGRLLFAVYASHTQSAFLNGTCVDTEAFLGVTNHTSVAVFSLFYTLRRPVMGEVLSTRIWGVPPAGGPLL